MKLRPPMMPTPRPVVAVEEASAEDAAFVLACDENLADGDTRSQWFWMRFDNGDLIFACFPQDGAYFATEGLRNV